MYSIYLSIQWSLSLQLGLNQGTQLAQPFVVRELVRFLQKPEGWVVFQVFVSLDMRYINMYYIITQTIHVWYISLHLPYKSTKCR